MARTRSTNESPLLKNAIQTLNPAIFSHPVWVRFGNAHSSANLKLVDNLLSNVKQLQNDDPESACQLLLICAVLQNHTHQRKNALKTIRQALLLAEEADILNARIWSVWGASAVCFQDENYEQTLAFLSQLKELLGLQNMWILADFIDIIQQSLTDTTNNFEINSSSTVLITPLNPILSVTFDWLTHWGQPITSTTSSSGPFHLRSDAQGTRLSTQWSWLKIKQTIQSKLKLPKTGSETSKTSSSISRQENVMLDPDINGLLVNKRHGASKTPCQPSKTMQRGSKKQNISVDEVSTITIIVQMLGSFSLIIQDVRLKIPASRGLSLLKYLILHHKQDTPREVLMDVFWPDSDPESARNNLNVAMHSLRQALHTITDFPLIRFEGAGYGLATDLEIWLDVEEFEHCIAEGKRLEAKKQPSAAITEYEIAVNLYCGDFLSDNPYESWTILERERLRIAYLDLLDHLSQMYFNQASYVACINLCTLMLTRDKCREDINCRLMRCYNRLGQNSLALRQYQLCTEALRAELEVDPAPETTWLYERIRRHEQI